MMLFKKVVFINLLSLALYVNYSVAYNDINLLSLGDHSTPQKVSLNTKINIYEELAPSLAVMKIFLGSKFKSLPSTFIEGKSVYPKELYDNVKAFFGSTKYVPKGDMYQAFDLTDKLTDKICKLIKFEQEENVKGNVVLYHGLSGHIMFMYRYFSELFSQLTGKEFPEYVLRGDHLYSINPDTGKPFQTLREIRTAYHIGDSYTSADDYYHGLSLKVLHCNIGLSVVPATSFSTVSSLGFCCNAVSVHNKTILDIVRSSLVFQGLSIAEANKCSEQVQEMFQEHFLKNHTKNGGLLAISLSKKCVDDLALPVYASFGMLYNPWLEQCINDIRKIFKFRLYTYEDWRCFTNDPVISYVSKLDTKIDMTDCKSKVKELLKIKNCSVKQDAQLSEILQQYLDLREANKPTITNMLKNISLAYKTQINSKEANQLTNEIALYLHPLVPTKIVGVFQYDADKPTELNTQLKEIVHNHVQMILNSKYQSVENTLLVPRQFPESPDKKNNIEIIPFLIEKGCFEQVESLIKDHPDFYHNPYIKSVLPSIIFDMLTEGYSEIFTFLRHIQFRDLLDEDKFDLFIPKLLRINPEFNKESIDYILTQNLSRNEQIVVLGMMLAFAQVDFSGRYIFLNAIDRLLYEFHSQQDLLKETFNLACSEKILVAPTVLRYMQHGFSLNPNDSIGKAHYDKVIQSVGKKELPSIVKTIANFYTLDPIPYDCTSVPDFNVFSCMKDISIDGLKTDQQVCQYFDSFTCLDKIVVIIRWLMDDSKQEVANMLANKFRYYSTSYTIQEAMNIFKQYNTTL